MAKANATARRAAATAKGAAANLPAVIAGAPTASNLPANGAAPEMPADKLTPAEKLAAALAGVTLPAANNGMAWLGLLAELPALAEIVAAARAGKYGNGKGLVNNPAEMLRLTPYGAKAGTAGTMKNGKPNAQAATCRAMQAAIAATGESTVCKAAVAFYMLTDAATLALLRQCKAVQYVGGKNGTPCPAWAGGYINGNVRAELFNRV
jgi:hypothetical protein